MRDPFIYYLSQNGEWIGFLSRRDWSERHILPIDDNKGMHRVIGNVRRATPLEDGTYAHLMHVPEGVPKRVHDMPFSRREHTMRLVKEQHTILDLESSILFPIRRVYRAVRDGEQFPLLLLNEAEGAVGYHYQGIIPFEPTRTFEDAPYTLHVATHL